MKLLRYGPGGHEQPRLLDSHGRIRSLAGSIPDLTADRMGRKPDPIFLAAGDTMSLGIAKLGEQRQSVIAWRRS